MKIWVECSDCGGDKGFLVDTDDGEDWEDCESCQAQGGWWETDKPAKPAAKS